MLTTNVACEALAQTNKGGRAGQQTLTALGLVSHYQNSAYVVHAQLDRLDTSAPALNARGGLKPSALLAGPDLSPASIPVQSLFWAAPPARAGSPR